MKAERKLYLAVIARAVADVLGAKINNEDPDEAIAFLDYHYPQLANRLRSMRRKREMIKLLDTIDENLGRLNG